MRDALVHEVRDPLSRARSALYEAARALRRPACGVPANRRAEAAMHMLARIDSALESILAGAVSRGGVPLAPRHDTDIGTIVALTIADVEPLERWRIGIERATQVRTASINAGLVRLALRNLLSNALACSPSGSPVVVRIDETDDPLALVIEVRDHGSGIRDDATPRTQVLDAADPCEQGFRERGLGLRIVRQVAQKHGGRVELKSAHGVGTVARILLPQGVA